MVGESWWACAHATAQERKKVERHQDDDMRQRERTPGFPPTVHFAQDWCRPKWQTLETQPPPVLARTSAYAWEQRSEWASVRRCHFCQDEPI